MRPDDLKRRTKAFAVQVIRLVEALPRQRAADVSGRPLLRSATSAGANYRAAQRARARAEFIATLGIVEEEADEPIYWLELLEETGLASPTALTPLLDEANQLLAITVAARKTARSTLNR